MTPKAFIDTNVLVYAYDVADAIKQNQALTLLASLDPSAIVISPQVLSEFYVTVSKRIDSPLSDTEAVEATRSLAALPSVPTTAALVSRALDVRTRWQLSYWDALIVAASEQAGCDQIFTEDLSTGAVIAGMTITNPFAVPAP